MAYSANQLPSGLETLTDTTIADADIAIVGDATDSGRAKGITWANIKLALKTYFDTVYAQLAGSVSQVFSVSSLELGHATDTTISRSSAGVIAVEGVAIPSISSTNTLTNKRVTKRVASAADDTTAVIDSDSYDEYYLTAMTAATEISVTGTPTAGQTIFIGLKDNGTSRALTWTGITGLGQTLPTATTLGKQHIIGIKYVASAWRAIAVGVEA